MKQAYTLSSSTDCLTLRSAKELLLLTALLLGCWLLPGSARAQVATAAPAGELADPQGGTSGHELVLCTDGSVMGWGYNAGGQLASPTAGATIATPALISLANPASVVQVATTHGSSFAIGADGSLWAWGDNSSGQLGIGSSITSTSTPTQVSGITKVIAVAGGFYHTLALRSDGTVWSWGQRSGGALGTGSTGAANVYTPQQVTGLPTIRAIASGDQFSMALDASGYIWSWGGNTNGELGNGAPQSAVQILYTPTKITTLSNVRQIEAGNVRAAALLANGTVYNWGHNTGGQLGLGHTNYTSTPTQVGAGVLTDIVDLALNTGATIAVHPDGTTHVWEVQGRGVSTRKLTVQH